MFSLFNKERIFTTKNGNPIDDYTVPKERFTYIIVFQIASYQ